MKKEVWNSDECRDQLVKLGGNVRRLRKERRMSIAALSQEVPIHHNALALLETGRRGADAVELIMLATFFGTTTDELLGMGVPASVQALRVHAEMLDRLAGVTERMDQLTNRLANMTESMAHLLTMRP